MTLQEQSSTYKSYGLAKAPWKHKNRPGLQRALVLLHVQQPCAVRSQTEGCQHSFLPSLPNSHINSHVAKASSTQCTQELLSLSISILQPLTPGACWLRQIGKLSAAECLLECFLIISGKYGLCIIINWTKHWRSVSQVPVNGAINSQRREVYSIWKLSFSIHLHSSPKVLSSGLLLSITLIRLIPS